MTEIRPATPEDGAATREVHLAAFGRSTEAKLVRLISERKLDWILDLGGPRIVEEENYRNDQATHLCGKAGSRQAGTDLATLSLAKNGAGKSHFCGQRESAVARVLQLREDRSQCVAPVAIDVLQGLAGMRQNLL